MTEKNAVTQQEQEQEPHVVKQGKRKTCMRHCKRFWWAYLIVFLCAVVLIVCLIIFVGIPNIAQDKLDSAELEVDGIIVTRTRSDSYNMAINSTIRSDGGVSATISPFTAEMYLEDLEPHTPFVYLDFPETTSAEVQTVNTSKEVEIPDMEAFTTFNTWLMANESVRVTVKGDTHVRVSGVSRRFGVTFKKTMTLAGLNHLDGLNVTYNEVSLTADDRGDNFHGWVDIPNPSIFTIELGNTSYHTYLNESTIGTSYIDDLVLYPGINNVSMRANISQLPVLAAMEEEPGCDTGMLPFQLQGQSVENEGDELSYFADALGASNLTVEINLGESFERDLGLTFSCDGDDES